eukprot:9498662-Pyramimonas_sp.AAC.1
MTTDLRSEFYPNYSLGQRVAAPEKAFGQLYSHLNRPCNQTDRNRVLVKVGSRAWFKDPHARCPNPTYLGGSRGRPRLVSTKPKGLTILLSVGSLVLHLVPYMHPNRLKHHFWPESFGEDVSNRIIPRITKIQNRHRRPF